MFPNGISLTILDMKEKILQGYSLDTRGEVLIKMNKRKIKYFENYKVISIFERIGRFS